MADASAAVEVRMVIMTTFQVNERSYCKQTRRILTEAGIVEARCGSSCVRTSANGRGCVKTRNAIRVRSILFVFQKKKSQNCTWVHQKRIVEALKTSQRGFLHTLGRLLPVAVYQRACTPHSIDARRHFVARSHKQA